jgi:hypothetical protein
MKLKMKNKYLQKNLFSAFLILFLSLIPISSKATPEDETRRIIQLAISGGATEELHRDFQKLISKYPANEYHDIVLLQKWHEATWQSAYETLRRGYLYTSPEFQALRERLLPIYGVEAIMQADSMLESVNKKIPIKVNPDVAAKWNYCNDMLIINEELALSVLAGIGLAVDRLENLLNPSWPPETKEFNYYDVGIRYIGIERLSYNFFPDEDENLLAWTGWQTLTQESLVEWIAFNYSKSSDQYDDNYILDLYTQLGLKLEEFAYFEWHSLPAKSFRVFEAGMLQPTIITVIEDIISRRTLFFAITSTVSLSDAMEESSRFLMRIAPIW